MERLSPISIKIFGLCNYSFYHTGIISGSQVIRTTTYVNVLPAVAKGVTVRADITRKRPLVSKGVVTVCPSNASRISGHLQKIPVSVIQIIPPRAPIVLARQQVNATDVCRLKRSAFQLRRDVLSVPDMDGHPEVLYLA